MTFGECTLLYLFFFFKDDTYQTCSERLAAENMYCLFISLIPHSRTRLNCMLIADLFAFFQVTSVVAPLRSQNKVACWAFSFPFAWTMDVL